MPFRLSVQGHWRVSVIQKDAGYSQRFKISDSSNADGVYPGNVGFSVNVVNDGQRPWILRIQHNDGSGWADSELRVTSRLINGSQITFRIESEDMPGSGDEDFNDLVLQADKVGMIEVAFRPYALRPETLQMMPDGVFEAILGNYYMGVRVENVWTETLPADSAIGISNLGRNLLAAGGIQVIDAWTPDEQAALGQRMLGNRVVLNALAPWEKQTVYFKLNCERAQPRKHTVQFEVTNPVMPDSGHRNRRASHSIYVTRSGFNPDTKEFVSECDRGRLYLKLRKVSAELTTLRDAVRCARAHRFKTGDTLSDRAREILKDLLEGKQVDLCDLKRVLDQACREGRGGKMDEWPCGDILMIPTDFNYRVEPNQPYSGQFGPLPFDDPWWKFLLILLAVILTIAAGWSMAADISYQSEDTVIGQLSDSVLNALKACPASKPPSTDPGSVDAAVVELNGNRSLTADVFSYLDAASGEANANPVISLNGHIDTSGGFLTNAEIDRIIQDLEDHPDDPAVQKALKVYKSGARTGVTHARIAGIQPTCTRSEDDGSTLCFLNQVEFTVDEDTPTTMARPGDSGSLWIQEGTNAIVALYHMGCSADNTAFGSRIEDVMQALKIRFR